MFIPDQREMLESLNKSVLSLRFGLFQRMRKKYAVQYGAGGNFLAAAVLNEAIAEPPGNKEAEAHLDQNSELVKSEANDLSMDVEIAEALSYLYAAEILQLSQADGQPFHERTFELSDKAAELSIVIRTVDELGGRGDARVSVGAIGEFASRFMEETLS